MEVGKFKCRVCLKPRSHLQDITDVSNLIEIPDFNSRTNLLEAFHQTTNILIEPSDVARLICDLCHRKLLDAFEFRKSAEHAESQIRHLVEQNLWCTTAEIVVKEEESESENHFEDFMVPAQQLKAEIVVEEQIKKEVNVERRRQKVNVDEMDQNAIFIISSKRYKRIGRRQDKKYICETCGEETSTKSQIVSHIRKTHLRGYGRKQPVKLDNWVKKQLKNGKKLVCDFCKAEFRSFLLITKHLRKTHMSPTPFGCSFRGCTNTFRTAIQRDTHYNRVHEGGRAMCEICGKDVKKTGMKEHLNSHRTDRPFKCPYENCGDAFKDKNCLTQHIHCRHSDVKKYGCHICGNNFKLSTSLQAHIRRMHTFKNCIQCKQCQKWFLNANELQLHTNKIHLGLRPHACEYCEASFKGKFHLNRHLKSSHPSEFTVMMQSGLLNIRKTSKYGMLPQLDAPKNVYPV